MYDLYNIIIVYYKILVAMGLNIIQGLRIILLFIAIIFLIYDISNILFNNIYFVMFSVNAAPLD